MALESMTGFGRGESSNEDFRVVVEIKSVNHRYKDFRFRMPSILNSQEILYKKKISESFSRGSFDISINYKRVEDNARFNDVDLEKVEAFVSKMKSIQGLEGIGVEVRPTDFLRSEFYTDMDENEGTLVELAASSFDGAIEKLKESRLEEGLKMKAVLSKHKQNYTEYFDDIDKNADTFQKTIEEKLRERLSEFKSEMTVDEPRLLQEVIFYLEKMDIHEEINRVKSHLEKLDKLIESDKEMGRQLDFLVQELNRETNTIGSKSSMVEISDNVVKMKVELEKIREQGLNLQ